MTRSRGKTTMDWLKQVVNIHNPDVTSAANLVLLSREYFLQDRTIYSNWRMKHIRQRWMKQQMRTNRDSTGGLTCAICGRKGLLPFVSDPNKLATLDHIVSIADGGVWNDTSNFQVSCHKCNVKKSQ